MGESQPSSLAGEATRAAARAGEGDKRAVSLIPLTPLSFAESPSPAGEEGILTAFAQHLTRDRRRSVHTVRAYVATAERLSDHLGAVRVPAAQELRAFLAARRADGLCNASAARELSAVRCFLEFIGGADANPRMKGPRVKKGVPRPVSPAEAMALAEDVAGAQDQA